MLFNSYPFLFVFLPAALAMCLLADGYPRLRCPVLIVLSLAFYAYWDIRFLPLMVLSISINWLLIVLYASYRRHSAIITLAIAGNVLVLGFFKYMNFFAENFAALGIPLGKFDIVLPLGISFFTFHHVMYLVDLRGGKAPLFSFERYALYICFFPQAIAGPLARWSEVMEQFGRRLLRPGCERRFVQGAALVILGLAQKVFLGDRLADTVNPIFLKATKEAITGSEALAAMLGFTFQIFFDFAGYSDIAIGLALIFGVVLPINFNSPYRSINIREFWRRWHMTLSRFLRDYVYIPLGGNRHGLSRQVAALLATMGLGGLWHGASWTFVVWGLLHGVALAAVAMRPEWFARVPRALSWGATFVFVVVTWVFFRAETFESAWRILAALPTAPFGDFSNGWRTIAIAAFVAIVIPPAQVLSNHIVDRPRRSSAILLGLIGVATLLEIGREQVHEFIYFRF
jgi:alginate O-acetyltransferase complex protein AlgI